MMRSLGWIRILSLVCSGLGAAQMMVAQTNHRGVQAGGTTNRQQPVAAQRPAPVAAAPKTATPNSQKVPAGAARPTPPTNTLKPSQTGAYTRQLNDGQPGRSAATAPASVAAPTQTQSPSVSMYQQSPYQQSPTVRPKVSQPSTQTSTPVQQSPTYSNGRFTGTPTVKGSPTVNGTPTTGWNSNSTTTKNPSSSDGNPNGSTATGTKSPTGSTQPQSPVATYEETVPSRGQSTGQQTTEPKPRVPPQTPQPVPVTHHPPRVPRVPLQTPPPNIQIIPTIPIVQTHVPPVLPLTTPTHEYQPPPSPVALQTSSAPLSPATAQPTNNGQQSQQQAPTAPSSPSTGQSTNHGQQLQQPTPKTQMPVGPGLEEIPSKPPQGTAPILPVALTLTTKTSRPVAGKDVVVVAALEPSQAGARYRLNWGDGSAVETVSESGTHRYAKVKTYKVSASTVVQSSELHHELLLEVKPAVGPEIAELMAVFAGLTLGAAFIFMPKFSATFHWGAPGAPEMRLLSREPYASLSFEPGIGPAEERISFLNKRRKSGLEQGQ